MTTFTVITENKDNLKNIRNSNRGMTKVSFSETFLIFKGRNKKLTSLFVQENLMMMTMISCTDLSTQTSNDLQEKEFRFEENF